jgi:hypothetical protein
MKVLKIIITNGYVLIIPILLWDYLFTSKLPSQYNPQTFNSNIPLYIKNMENIFRTVILTLPLLFRIDISSSIGKKGMFLYIVGSVIYYVSWLLLMYAPTNKWSKSIFGQAAPAYTPIIWLIGIGLMVDSYYFNFKYSKWHYIVPAIIFSIFHVTHTLYVMFGWNIRIKE